MPIDGRSLSIRRSPSGSEKLVFMSTDPDVPFPAAGGPNDPRVAGATLEVITEGEGTAVFEMPPGNWTANGPATVFKFVNEQAPGGPSTVKVTLLKQGRIADDERAWRTFERRYRKEMSAPPASRVLDLLAALSHRTDLAVGCYCADEARCHRSILRELLLERQAEVV